MRQPLALTVPRHLVKPWGASLASAKAAGHVWFRYGKVEVREYGVIAGRSRSLAQCDQMRMAIKNTIEDQARGIGVKAVITLFSTMQRSTSEGICNLLWQYVPLPSETMNMYSQLFRGQVGHKGIRLGQETQLLLVFCHFDQGENSKGPGRNVQWVLSSIR